MRTAICADSEKHKHWAKRHTLRKSDTKNYMYTSRKGKERKEAAASGANNNKDYRRMAKKLSSLSQIQICWKFPGNYTHLTLELIVYYRDLGIIPIGYQFGPEYPESMDGRSAWPPVALHSRMVLLLIGEEPAVRCVCFGTTGLTSTAKNT